ncbi:hypothetical protein KY290_007378 [Solanum tuberosum]|uniref:Uncharacterized protein n=1 Tax=Solanum tuberosum TaxID=4113 RepID=A0ABQ7W840_SOLTU|nr:hypothetical protein KY290_007378 [Solanum tuberosum]
MDTNIHVFSLWEEHVVSQEMGRRVVHYYLRIPQGSMFKPHAMCCLRGLFGCFWAHKYHEFQHKVACKNRGSGMAGVFDFKASLITIYFKNLPCGFFGEEAVEMSAEWCTDGRSLNPGDG